VGAAGAGFAAAGSRVPCDVADGEVRDVDITPLLDTEAFAPLHDQEVFGQ
jgi:hypothetical protein